MSVDRDADERRAMKRAHNRARDQHARFWLADQTGPRRLAPTPPNPKRVGYDDDRAFPAPVCEEP